MCRLSIKARRGVCKVRQCSCIAINKQKQCDSIRGNHNVPGLHYKPIKLRQSKNFITNIGIKMKHNKHKELSREVNFKLQDWINGYNKAKELFK